MKRITASIITGIMIFCLSACGSSNTEKDSSIVSESRDTQTSEKTKEPETQTVSESSQTEETQTDKSRPEDGEGSQTAEESQKSGDGQDEEENQDTDEKQDADENQDTDENQNADEGQGAGESQDEQDAGSSSAGGTDNDSYGDGQQIGLDPSWEYAEYAKITSGEAVMYRASSNRKGIVVGVNAGHGTSGGESVKTLCHPDGSPKTTGGTTGAGAVKAIAVSGGMTFDDGTPESTVTLKMAKILKSRLLAAGYDVLMIRDDSDVQLDNVARTVICNNVADCHIALHWDGDGLSYDKGCFYISVPDGIKDMEPVASHWREDDALGECLIEGLSACGAKINGGGSMSIDLTQTSYSTVPSVDIELGNACSDHSESALENLADGLVMGVESFF
ncbi:MAG: N-acetylmuramoyl-L-alanine amidase [Agathobacter sp.]|nr:N-acetylmuramoyl-L-alanine amidase [uncultured Agathobacter sp.]MDY6155367.1 N-acetylmuramoyl-L-alanine amidase [Agathobacter sp.]